MNNVDLAQYGRKIELMLFGSTQFFHICTCYVKSPNARKLIRLAKLNNCSDAEIVAQYGHYMSADAPILRLIAENSQITPKFSRKEE